ncbi:MAG: IS630 family transposase [Symploca sp. SIO3E6]|nr:IS630 family transposase [Caldora sp. SIO3E6]
MTRFIESNPEPRELTRALAIKMSLLGENYQKIQDLLGMSKRRVLFWKKRFDASGINGIKLSYKGRKSYLTAEQKAETIAWLQSQNYYLLSELFDYLKVNYNVVYKSRQSYYNLLSQAQISWKKSQKINPKYDWELVKKKQQEIRDFLEQNQAEIESGELSVFFLDECHLLWGDVCGYVWGKSNERIEIPILNQKERTTYFGAVDYLTKEFIVKEYSAGNGEHTIDFIKYLQSLRKKSRIVIFWDGAKYHSSAEVKKFLTLQNEGLEKSEWKVYCEKLAPNAPEQNPVEDIWLQAKNFLRKFWMLCKSFQIVKFLFTFFTHLQKFDFPKLREYEPGASSLL